MARTARAVKTISPKTKYAGSHPTETGCPTPRQFRFCSLDRIFTAADWIDHRTVFPRKSKTARDQLMVTSCFRVNFYYLIATAYYHMRKSPSRAGDGSDYFLGAFSAPSASFAAAASSAFLYWRKRFFKPGSAAIRVPSASWITRSCVLTAFSRLPLSK